MISVLLRSPPSGSRAMSCCPSLSYKDRHQAGAVRQLCRPSKEPERFDRVCLVHYTPALNCEQFLCHIELTGLDNTMLIALTECKPIFS